MKTTYLIDPVSTAMVGPVIVPVVPGVGRQLPSEAVELPKPLAEPGPGTAWAWKEGAPTLLPDHRGIVYNTETGAAQHHSVLGALPDGLTEKPWPGQFHEWSGAAWELNESARMAAAHAVERAWRNAQIAASDYLAMPDYPITPEQRSELYLYRQALRDWPDVTVFPDQSGRPMPPDWIALLPE